MSVLKAERTDFVRKGGGNVSEPAHQILKDARKEAGLTQIQVAALLSVSVEQVKRMERGDWIPEMADVDMMEEQLRDVGLFRRWARAQYPEIVKYFGASDRRELGLLGAVVNTKHQIDDVLKLQDRVERDAVDGQIDPTLRNSYRQELEEAREAIETALGLLQI